MALDKAIKNGKEKRSPYPAYKHVDPMCRNHGGCKWCTGNRTRADRVARTAADEQLRDIEPQLEV